MTEEEQAIEERMEFNRILQILEFEPKKRISKKQIRFLVDMILNRNKKILGLTHLKDSLIPQITMLQTRILSYRKDVERFGKEVARLTSEKWQIDEKTGRPNENNSETTETS